MFPMPIKPLKERDRETDRQTDRETDLAQREDKHSYHGTKACLVITTGTDWLTFPIQTCLCLLTQSNPAPLLPNTVLVEGTVNKYTHHSQKYHLLQPFSPGPLPLTVAPPNLEHTRTTGQLGHNTGHLEHTRQTGHLEHKNTYLEPKTRHT